ncbi:response regulator transcription factor [Dactylosporangium sp. NPDC051484]|uniref:response regulator transcription factor n=1 Tax=Dactylosporangium sp. NPDC051484 TaxID=3154942 RepID=UPI003450CA28
MSADAGDPTRFEREAGLVYVLIAACNEVLRAGIAALIKPFPGFAVSETSVGTVALVGEVQARRPDVLLVDIAIAGSLRDFFGPRAEDSLADIAVVALAPDDLSDVDVLRDLVQRGVDGIVTANDQAPQLSGAIKAVHRGRRWLSPALGGHLLNLLARPSAGLPSAEASDTETSLTQQERRVLALVADGLTVGQIAKRLHRSESAVKYHLSNMSARYQASNRAHLVYLAVQAGELPIG